MRFVGIRLDEIAHTDPARQEQNLSRALDRIAALGVNAVLVSPFTDDLKATYFPNRQMPLKSDLLNEHGSAVEQVMFTNIAFLKEVPPELLQPTLSGNGYVWHNDPDVAGETVLSNKTDWHVTRLPDGFMLTHHSRHPMPDSKVPTEHLVFSDALASLSVYIDQAGDDKRMLNGMSHMGAVNAYGAIVSGYHVTVVGDVPRATVQMVGESLRYQPVSGQ